MGFTRQRSFLGETSESGTHMVAMHLQCSMCGRHERINVMDKLMLRQDTNVFVTYRYPLCSRGGSMLGTGIAQILPRRQPRHNLRGQRLLSLRLLLSGVRHSRYQCCRPSAMLGQKKTSARNVVL